MKNTDPIQIAYKSLQQGKSLAGLLHKGVSTKLMELLAPDSIPETSEIGKEMLMELKSSMDELEKEDWKDAEEGLYPKRHLFKAPWIEWLKKYPLIWLDMPSTWERRKSQKIDDIPKKIKKENYPQYYLQNFHHQTDGYLSDHSAEIYDIQVEILFNGTADSMRRRILSPLKKGLDQFEGRCLSSMKILDVATGTGRTLEQIRSAFPSIELFGLDLSSSYLKQANKYLNTSSGELVQFIKGNAECMPFSSRSFQGLTCVFLFHELPKTARQKVINECFRLLEPGGVFVIADSIQFNDSPQFAPVMDNFRKFFHEPYYLDYVKDNIDKRLEDAGFIHIKAKSHFMTRVWSAYKPKY